MSNRPLRKEIRTDFAGSYTAYIYPDGHVETDPPGRPKSREDLQRERRLQAVQQQTLAIVAADQTRRVPGAPPRVLRANADTMNGRVLTAPYFDILQKIATTADTVVATPDDVDTLLTVVPLGGAVVGARAGSRPEYDLDTLPAVDSSSMSSPTRI